MDPQRWARIESLYHAALAKTPDERPRYLAAVCAEEPEIQRQVESLLDCADAEAANPPRPDKRLGTYEILGHGRGLPRNGYQAPARSCHQALAAANSKTIRRDWPGSSAKRKFWPHLKADVFLALAKGWVSTTHPFLVNHRKLSYRIPWLRRRPVWSRGRKEEARQVEEDGCGKAHRVQAVQHSAVALDEVSPILHAAIPLDGGHYEAA